MNDLEFVCPDCRMPLARSKETLCCANDHQFSIRNGIYCLLPHAVSELTLEEGRYHADQKNTWLEQHQIHTLRNLRAHERFITSIVRNLTRTSRILEIGGGIGFDLEMFLGMVPNLRCYVFSESSEDLVDHVAQKIKSDRVTYCTLDALQLPFADAQFDCVFMVATLHHLPDLDAALREMIRVTNVGGLICCGVEPNRWWLRALSKSRWLLRKVLPKTAHSAADEEATGFEMEDFSKIADRHHIMLLDVQPVWLASGFAHYGLEFLYRFLRLKRRLRLPVLFEKSLLAIDDRLLTVRSFKKLAWHCSVVYRKTHDHS